TYAEPDNRAAVPGGADISDAQLADYAVRSSASAKRRTRTGGRHRQASAARDTTATAEDRIRKCRARAESSSPRLPLVPRREFSGRFSAAMNAGVAKFRSVEGGLHAISENRNTKGRVRSTNWPATKSPARYRTLSIAVRP